MPEATAETAASNSSNAANDASNTRLDKTTACLPIVYGSIALKLSKKESSATADYTNTHSWTLYLRGPHCEDLSSVIGKVVFMLHPSFAQPVRELTSPPYQVTERGWGEFEAEIRIHWKKGSDERPTHVMHGIRLYPPGGAPGETPVAGSNNNNKQSNKDPPPPVVAETYDQVVFTNPKEEFFKQLQQVVQSPPISDYSHAVHFPKYSDTNDFLALIEAQKFLQHQLGSVQERLQAADQELASLDEQIVLQIQVQQKQQNEEQLAAQQAAALQEKSGGTKKAKKSSSTTTTNAATKNATTTLKTTTTKADTTAAESITAATLPKKRSASATRTKKSTGTKSSTKATIRSGKSTKKAKTTANDNNSLASSSTQPAAGKTTTLATGSKSAKADPTTKKSKSGKSASKVSSNKSSSTAAAKDAGSSTSNTKG